VATNAIGIFSEFTLSTRCGLSWPSASGPASDNQTLCEEFDVTFGIWLGAQT
jgi:hypothetical protein